MTELVPTVTCRRCSTLNRADASRCSQCSSFLPRNTAAMVHGARRGPLLDEATIAARTEIEVALDGGPGMEDRFLPARELAARALAQVRSHADRLERIGPYDGKGRPRQELDQLHRALTTAERWMSAFGMTPSSAAKLGVDLARRATLAEEIAQAKANR